MTKAKTKRKGRKARTDRSAAPPAWTKQAAEIEQLAAVAEAVKAEQLEQSGKVDQPRPGPSHPSNVPGIEWGEQYRRRHRVFGDPIGQSESARLDPPTFDD